MPILATVQKGGLDYVKSVLNGHNQIINYINPYDEMIKNDEKMIKEIINQYEHPIYSIDETEDFIYNHIGYKNFFDMLMDEYGEKIKNFYIRKTKDC